MKKFLSVLLSLALCVGVLPALVQTAEAAATDVTSVTVGGLVMNAENPYYTNDETGLAGAVTAEQPAGGNYLHFDADTATLTIHGEVTVRYATSADCEEIISFGDIYTHEGNLHITGGADAVLTLINTSDYAESEGIGTTWLTGGELTITGGTINIKNVTVGIFVGNHLTISGSDTKIYAEATAEISMSGSNFGVGSCYEDTLITDGAQVSVTGFMMGYICGDDNETENGDVDYFTVSNGAQVEVEGPAFIGIQAAHVDINGADTVVSIEDVSKVIDMPGLPQPMPAMIGIGAAHTLNITDATVRVDSSDDSAAAAIGISLVAGEEVPADAAVNIGGDADVQLGGAQVSCGIVVMSMETFTYSSTPLAPNFSGLSESVIASVNADGSNPVNYDPEDIATYKWLHAGTDPVSDGSEPATPIAPSVNDNMETVLDAIGDYATGNIYGTYHDDSEAQTKYYVDVIWGNFQFTYYATNSQNWDPTKHTVEGVAEGDWRPYAEEDASITVVNHSNIGVTASLEVTPNDAIVNGVLDATFTEKETRHATVDAENASIELVNAKDVSAFYVVEGMSDEEIAAGSAAALANAPKATVLMALSGGELADDHAAGDPIATVTVTLQ